MGDQDRPGIGRHVRWFFTNWREYDGPTSRKLWLTLKNRTRGIVSLKACCGHPGDPGC
jgi:hypothetical protein